MKHLPTSAATVLHHDNVFSLLYFDSISNRVAPTLQYTLFKKCVKFTIFSKMSILTSISLSKRKLLSQKPKNNLCSRQIIVEGSTYIDFAMISNVDSRKECISVTEAKSKKKHQTCFWWIVNCNVKSKMVVLLWSMSMNHTHS